MFFEAIAVRTSPREQLSSPNYRLHTSSSITREAYISTGRTCFVRAITQGPSTIYFKALHRFRLTIISVRVKISALLTVISLALTLCMEGWITRLCTHYFIYIVCSLDRCDTLSKLVRSSNLQAHQHRCSTRGHDSPRDIHCHRRICRSVRSAWPCFGLFSFRRSLGAVALPNNMHGESSWNIFLVTGKSFIFCLQASLFNIPLWQFLCLQPLCLAPDA